MKITIESTSKVVNVNGVDCRVWEGQTERGIPIHCFIPRIGVKNGLDCSQFEAELVECKPPSAEIAAFPARMIL
jgi:hypothetical protein